MPKTKTVLKLLVASSLLAIGLFFSYAMLISNGKIEINNFNEGWLESLWFLIIGLVVYYNYLKGAWQHSH